MCSNVFCHGRDEVEAPGRHLDARTKHVDRGLELGDLVPAAHPATAHSVISPESVVSLAPSTFSVTVR